MKLISDIIRNLKCKFAHCKLYLGVLLQYKLINWI